VIPLGETVTVVILNHDYQEINRIEARLLTTRPQMTVGGVIYGWCGEVLINDVPAPVRRRDDGAWYKVSESGDPFPFNFG